MIDAGELEKGDISGWLELVKFDFKNWGYGILTPESVEDGRIVVKLDESMSSAGIPNLSQSVCYYEGGRITGGLSQITGDKWQFVETNCWGRGDKFCRFEITKI